MGEWIEHDGKGMPVDGDTLVLVKFRDSSPHYSVDGSERKASFWHHDNPKFSNWSNLDAPADIIAYRIVSSTQEQEGT